MFNIIQYHQYNACMHSRMHAKDTTLLIALSASLERELRLKSPLTIPREREKHNNKETKGVKQEEAESEREARLTRKQ